MKKTIIVFIFALLINMLYSIQSTTLAPVSATTTFWNGSIAKTYNPATAKTPYKHQKINQNRAWTLVDSVSLKDFIQTTATSGYYTDIYFKRSDETLHRFSSDSSTITETAKTAIQKAPAWLRHRLNLKFKSIPSTKQNLWANLILNTQDPYVDEVAFAIATLSPAYLMSSLASTDVILSNAIDIYMNDISLDYVEVVDYGTSEDDNYYSTVRYWKMNDSGNLEQVEMPKEIYYWYIAHPEITDEIPAFINPLISEYDHHANIVSPSEGYFWRDYIYNTTFNDTLNLRSMMQGCNYVWDGIGRSYLGNDWFAEPISPYGDSLDYAIHRFTKWINGDMEFTSPGDRPHQPVRIAFKGMGRCGEYADLNAAVARSLLIPATSISNWVNIWDHTFSELWQEDFIHYESYYWEWGETFYDTYDYYAISPYEIRSDGYLRTVTQHYLDYSTLNVYILDENDYPIDGAKVKLYVERPDDGIRQTMEAFTDNSGLVTFTVSDSFPYYARAETAIGNSPASGSTRLIENPVDGESYDFALNVENSAFQSEFSQVQPPANNMDDYKVEVQFSVPYYAVRGTILHNDIDGDASTETYDRMIENGTLDFFVTDQSNSDLFLADIPFNAVFAQTNTNGCSYEFELPEENDWHFIFSNKLHVKNPQYLNGYLKLYQYSASTDDNDIVANNTTLLQNYPNPFNPVTTISYTLPQNTKNAEIEIYNLKGQRVRTFPINRSSGSAIHQVIWNGKDESGKNVSSGIYFYRLSVDNKIIDAKKCMLMK